MNLYNFDNESWYKKQIPSFQDITIQNFRKLGIKPQIALVVATELEHKSVLKEIDEIPEEGCRYRIQYEKQTYFIGFFGVHCAVVIRAATMGDVGPTAATTTVMNLLVAWNPYAIVSVGIAMGYDKTKHKAGDVLISSSIANYESSKLHKGQNISRTSIPNVSSVLLNRFQNDFEWQFQKSDGILCDKHFGLILAGGKLINDPAFKKKLWKRFPEAIGAEMEGCGIWSAADNKDKDWIIVKSVCDWGDGNKDDSFQTLAAASAVSLCKSIFKSENALEGIVKKNYKMTNNARINSFKLFFHRNYMKKYSLAKIKHLTKIPSSKIKELETVALSSNGFDSVTFPKCQKHLIAKLEKALDCTNGFLCTDNFDDFYSYYISYYFKHKLDDDTFLNNHASIKAIIFDFDGTLTKPGKKISTWQRIWLRLGYELNDCAKYIVQFKQGKITHQEWCEITCQKFQEKDFSLAILEEIAKDIHLVDGTIETLRQLKNNNIKIFITSGSIKELIKIVLGEENNHLFDEIVANSIQFDNKGLIEKIIGTRYDFQGKAKFISEVIETNNYKPYEVLFVGNSDNDDWAYKSGAHTLCVNPNNTNYSNAKRWHNLLMEMKNLKEIRPYIGGDFLN